MKKLLILIIFILFIALKNYAQWTTITTPYTSNFNAVYFVDKNTGWICGDGGLILHTTNRGITWIEQESGTTENLYDIEFCSSNTGYAVGTMGTILKTTDSGVTWNLQLSGITSQLNSISVLDSENVKIAGDKGKLLKTTNGGILWEVIQFGNSYIYSRSIFFVNSNKGWLCGYIFNPTFTYVYFLDKTQNGGNTWQNVMCDMGILNDVFFVNENYGWVTGLFRVIMVTTDGGNSWISKNFSNEAGQANCAFLIRDGVGWIIDHTMFGEHLRFSSDGGDSWLIQVQNPTRFSDMIFVDQKYGWVVGENGLIIFTDNGGGVFPSTPNLFIPENNQLLISDSIKFIWSSATPQITGYNFYLSTDSLFSNLIDTLIIDTTILINNLELNTKYYWKVKAKNEIGFGNESEIYSFTTTMTGIDRTSQISHNFSLSQNYPNPFSAKGGSASGGNPSTTIQYTISNRQFVTLKVYNLLGEEVATLVNEEQSAGSYKIEFNLESSTKYLSAGSKGPASGVYFYQLKAGNFVETKKMIYLR